jgi:low affinity Fe/Cu permease
MTAEHANLSASSRVVHRLDRVTTHPFAATSIAAGVVIAFVAVALSGFDAEFQTAFATVCSGITVTIVFVLQHTQRRAQIATQVKLDELVRAMPQADNRVVRIEAASTEELDGLAASQQRIHDRVRRTTRRNDRSTT